MNTDTLLSLLLCPYAEGSCDSTPAERGATPPEVDCEDEDNGTRRRGRRSRTLASGRIALIIFFFNQ